MLIGTGDDILRGAIEVAEREIHLLRAIIPQGLRFLNRLVHLSCGNSFVVTESHLFHALLTLRPAE